MDIKNIKGVKATPTPQPSGGTVPKPTGWTAQRIARQPSTKGRK